MNKHEQIESDLLFLEQRYPFIWLALKGYIKEAKATEKAYEELKKDVQRYFELSHNPRSNENPNEVRPYIEWACELTILEKSILSKVGKE